MDEPEPTKAVATTHATPTPAAIPARTLGGLLLGCLAAACAEAACRVLAGAVRGAEVLQYLTSAFPATGRIVRSHPDPDPPPASALGRRPTL